MHKGNDSGVRFYNTPPIYRTVLYLIIMKVLILAFLSLLVSCGPSVTPTQKKDSILNYKGATIITKDIGLDNCYKIRIRIYDKNAKRYVIKTIYVYDGYGYGTGAVIK